MMYDKYEKEIRNYILDNVKTVLKEPHSFIRFPFIDPGSVYDGNVWDWDTYWSVYGLFDMIEDFPEEIQEKIVKHAKGNIHNFLDHQMPDGYIPMMIEVADWKEPYLNMRHKEGITMNMHKPFLCMQVCLISRQIQDYGWIKEKLAGIRKYFAYYRETYYNRNKGLYVWCDDIMIGMDNDPASFGRPGFSTANIFLNSFMVCELRCMAELLEHLSQEGADEYKKQADELIENIQRECWDERDHFFYSVDVDIYTRKFDWFHQGLGVFWKTLPIRIRVWSGFIPLWAGFATAGQGDYLAAQYRDKEIFYSDYGVTTLAKNEKMFNLEATNNPSNWLGPIWLVANYIVFKGLLDYGHTQEALAICRGSLKLLGEDLEKTQCMHEYYNPFTGEPVMNGGFINWNILALSMAKELRKRGIKIEG